MPVKILPFTYNLIYLFYSGGDHVGKARITFMVPFQTKQSIHHTHNRPQRSNPHTLTMAASGRTASFLHRSSRVKSPQLILATIVVSASSPLSSVPSTAESFPIIGGGQRRQQGTFGFVHRNVHLPSRKFKPLASSSSDDATGEGGGDRSVTGPIYELDSGVPIVKLFTKEGCTLCDKVKDVRCRYIRRCQKKVSAFFL